VAGAATQHRKDHVRDCRVRVDMLAHRKLGKRGGGALAAVLAVTALAACGGGGSGSSDGPAATGSATAAATAAPIARAPKRGDGSAVALSNDGQRLFVADEEHEVVFVAPTAFHDAAALRVVPLPGPPAQVVVAGDHVLVTVRTLPAEEAKAARAEIRGPAPEAANARRLAAIKGRWFPLFQWE
jgi:hypothetical protein